METSAQLSTSPPSASPSVAVQRLPARSSRRISTSEATIADDPFAFWCCELRNPSTSSSGCGVLAEIPELRDLPNRSRDSLVKQFPGLRKVAEKICPPANSTSYVLVLAHHIIPGMSSINGWTMTFGATASGRKVLGLKTKHSYALDSVVIGAVSCCGADSIVIDSVHDLKEHPGKYCEVELDFTIFFLNANIKSTISSVKQPSLPQISLGSSDPQEPDGTKRDLDTLRQQLESFYCPIAPSDASESTPQATNQNASGNGVLYYRQEAYVDQIPIGLHVCNPLLQSEGLREQVEHHGKFQKLLYACDSDISEGFSGSPIVHYPQGVSGQVRLLAVHLGVSRLEEEEEKISGRCYVAVSIYGMVRLIQGDIVACLYFMRHPQARRLMPAQWTSLFHAYLSEHPRLDLKFLLHLLYLLLVKRGGTRLIHLHVTTPRENKVAALHLLNALFQHFGRFFKSEMIAEIETGEVLGGETHQQLFIACIRDLCHEMMDVLSNVESDRDYDREESVVEACFQCWNSFLNFKYNTVSDILTSSTNLARLGSLNDKYSDSLMIQRHSVAIYKKCRLFQESKHKDASANDLQQFQEQKRKLKDEIAQKSSSVEELKGKLQQAQQEINLLSQQKAAAEESSHQKEAEVQELRQGRDEKVTSLEQQLGREKKTAREGHEKLEEQNQRLRQQIVSMQHERQKMSEDQRGLQETIQTLNREKAALKEHKDKAETLSQQLNQKVATLRTRNDELDRDLREVKAEKEVAEYKSRQNGESKTKLEAENKELRRQAQSLSKKVEEMQQQLATMAKQLEEAKPP